MDAKESRGALNIVVVGAGMYVCGRGTPDHGTIMPAILEWRRSGVAGEVMVVGRSHGSLKTAKAKIRELCRKVGVDPCIKYVHADGSRSYKRICSGIKAPACAIIAIPDYAHAEVVKAALDSGLHTLVVKPLAPTLKDVEDLVDSQKRNGVYGAVEFHKRLDQANLKLKDAVQNGSIGDPLYIVVEYSQRKTVPARIFKGWVETTNVFQYLGTHYVDIISWATGAIPLRAMALGQKSWLASQGIDTYDSIEAMVEWRMPSGVKFVSAIMTNWVDPDRTSAMSDQKIKVVGTRGRFESDQKDRGVVVVTDEAGVQQPNPYFCASYGPKGGASYKGYGIESINQFLNDVTGIEAGVVRIRDLEKERPVFSQSIIPTMVLAAVNMSLKAGGKWISINKRKA